MSKTVGVYFQKFFASISYWTGGRQQIYSIKYQNSIDDVLTNQDCFCKCFNYLNDYLKKNECFDDISWVVGIPDSFGIKEKMQLFEFAENTSINIARLMSYSMAAAFSLSLDYHELEDFCVVVDNGKDLEIGTFEIGDGVTEKISIHLFKDCRWGEFDEFYKPGRVLLNPKTYTTMFELSQMKKIFYIITEVSKRNSDNIYQHLPNEDYNVIYLSENDITKGLGLQCGKLAGNTECKNVFALDMYSPYQVCVSVNQNMYDLLSDEVTIPTKRSIDIVEDTIEDDLNDGLLIRLLERRGNRYIPQAETLLDRTEAQAFLGKKFSLAINVDTSCKTHIELINEDGYNKTYPLKVFEQSKNEIPKKRDNSNEEPLLLDLIPVFSNLFYGARNVENVDDPYIKGMSILYSQAKDALNTHGVEFIDQVGVPFDINYHYAVEHVVDSDLPADTVTKINQIGYTINGKVIKPASVVVAN